MGIDVSGGMIVGIIGSELIDAIKTVDDFNEWYEINGLDRMATHYDADNDDCFFGFQVEDVPVSEMKGIWLKDVEEKAKRFKELTGIDASLIGTQDVW